MIIERIQLKYFVKMTLGDITELDYAMVEPLQLIIGANGCGKTSLLGVTNPMPGVPADYRDGGYKKVWLSHNGNRFYLESTKLGKSMKHKFCIFPEDHNFLDDEPENLNRGGTVGVQKELVEKHIGYTPELHKLLSGKFSFTGVTAAAREDIFTKLSGTSTTYAIALYKKIKGLHRDCTGAIKHLDNKHEELIATLEASGNPKDLTVRINAGKEILKELTPLTLNRDAGVMAKRLALNNAMSMLTGHIDSCMKRYSTRMPVHGLTSESDAQTKLRTEQDKLAAMLALIDKNVTELDGLTKIQKRSEGSDVSTDELKKQITKLKSVATTPVTEGVDYSSSEQEVLEELNAVKYTLFQESSVYESVKAGVCTKDEYGSMKSALAVIDKDLNQCGANISRLENEIASAERGLSQALDCNKCGNKVTADPKLTQTYIDTLRATLVTHQDKRTNIETHRKEQMSKGEQMHSYVEYYNRILKMLKDAFRLHPFWGSIDGGVQWCVTHPSELNALMTKEVLRLETLIKTKDASTRLKDCEDMLAMRSLAVDVDVAGKMRTLRDDLDTLYKDRDLTAKKISTLEHLIKDYRNMVTAMDGLIEMHDNVIDKLGDHSEAHIYESIGEIVTKEQHSLGVLMDQLHKHDILKGTIASLKADREELEKKRRGFGNLIKSLSPKTGIIGETMSAFVNEFLDKMNDIIGELWEYEMRIQPCAMEESGMDYKFPLQVKEETTPNFADASKGQREVIDFAFVQVLMAYSGLGEYPLYLDEVGGGFDHAHKSRFVSFINLLIESGNCSQMFMVNHYSAEHGGLNHMEAVVLNTNNVLLPDEYNNHVSMK